MKRVFADTSYWIALLNPRDQLHTKAVRVSKQLASARIVTSEMVLAELLNSFSDARGLRKVAGSMVEMLRGRRELEIVPQTPQQFEGALNRFNRTEDKSWSLTDCASFGVMESAGIRAALTHDQHFAQAGFEALLR